MLNGKPDPGQQFKPPIQILHLFHAFQGNIHREAHKIAFPAVPGFHKIVIHICILKHQFQVALLDVDFFFGLQDYFQVVIHRKFNRRFFTLVFEGVVIKIQLFQNKVLSAFIICIVTSYNITYFLS